MKIKEFDEMEMMNQANMREISKPTTITDEDIVKMDILKGRDSFWDFENQKIILKGFDTLREIEDLISSAISTMESKRQKIEANEARANKLKSGSLTKDGRMWFNYESASMFIQAFVTMEESETLFWYDKDRIKVELDYAKAKAYAKEIRVVLQGVYGL